MLEYVALVIFAVCVIAALALSLVGMSGPLLVVFGAIVFNVISWSRIIPVWMIALLAGIALAGDLLESVVLVHKFRKNVSVAGQEGLFVGAMLGSSALKRLRLVGQIIGFIAGSVSGLFVGEFAFSRDFKKSWSVVKKLLVAKLLMSVIKVVLVLLQTYIVIKEISQV